ncbi:MAG: hypothetical protein QG588_1394, partial [Candidatus Poribacteria bacterium]|nr:hypothetical protein [Candidatus Poribacteria bacterium]
HDFISQHLKTQIKHKAFVSGNLNTNLQRHEGHKKVTSVQNKKLDLTANH